MRFRCLKRLIMDEFEMNKPYCALCSMRHVKDGHLSKQRRWEKRNVERVRASNRERARRFRAAHAGEKIIGN